MMFKDILSITLVAVTMFLGMLFGFLGMCGVNIHTYSLIATVTIVADTYWIYKKICEHEEQHQDDSED